MKKNKAIMLVIGLIISIALLVISYQTTNTGRWVKGSDGQWISEGNPSKTPLKVIDQQMKVLAARALYDDAVAARVNLGIGPCLGTIGNDWVVDIVHLPRSAIDDEPANQCSEYISGLATNFIELDTSGHLVRIVD
ncbi:MAG: hypothetical protein V1838_00945 [Patescibacteria group bacterium]